MHHLDLHPDDDDDDDERRDDDREDVARTFSSYLVDRNSVFSLAPSTLT
jgi:hypothetical protein